MATKYYFWILFFPLLIVPLLAIPAGYIIDEKWYLSTDDYLIVFIIFIIFIFHIAVFEYYTKNNSSLIYIYSEKKLFYSFILLFLIAFSAFSVNIFRVVSEGLLLGQGRVYEHTFGKYTLINYLYFLNGFLVSSYFLFQVNIKNIKYKKIINYLTIISFLTLFFHGVKGTILFPLIALFFSYILIYKKIPKKIIMSLTLVVILAFSANFYIRMGDELLDRGLELVSKKIILYLSPAYSNLFLEMEHNSPLSGGIYTGGVIISLFNYVSNGFTKEKSFDPTTNKLTGHVMYLVDNSYNTGTIFRDAYYDFSFAGFFIYIFFISLFMVFIYNKYKYKKSFISIYVVSLFSVSLLFIFWGNHFLRIQYLYWIAVASLLHTYSKKGYIVEK